MEEPVNPQTPQSETTGQKALQDLLGQIKDLSQLPEKPGACPESAGNQLLKYADQTFDDVFNLVYCKTGWKTLAYGIASIAFGILRILARATGLVAGTITALGATLAGTILSVLGGAREETAPQLNTLMVTVLNEMFGTDFTPDDLPKGGSAADSQERARKMGQKISSLLESEFTGLGNLSPEQGERAANTFTGYTVNFSIVSAFIAIIADMVGGEHGAGFRELGVELADNLGLGRMSRKGITELVGTCVATPYEWQLNKRYRPKLLGANTAVRAWLSGSLTREELEEELARQGYDDKRINATIFETFRDLSFQHINILRQFGRINEADTITLLKRMGYSEGNAQQVLEAEDLAGAQAASRAISNRLLNEMLSGAITETEFTEALNNLAFTDKERTTIIGMAGQLSRLPRVTLTLAQMREAYIHATIDITEFEQYLIRRGYRQEDRTILIIELLLDAKAQSKSDELKAQRQAEIDAKRAEAGSAP